MLPRARPPHSKCTAQTTGSTSIRTPALLMALYVFTVLTHLWLLHGVWVAPYIAHDEVQYCLTGENVRAGHGFMMRGAFPSTVPPLFPLFVALGRSLSENPRLSLFVLSVLVVCTLLFPVYLMCRDLGLGNASAATVALISTLLPQTFYAGMYMSEILQLPLFFLAFWLCLRWLRSGYVVTGALLGAVFGVMALNRFATFTFFTCFVITALAALLAPAMGRFQASRSRAAGSLGMIVAGAFLFQGAWWGYKLAHHVSPLGTYSQSATAWGHPPLALFVAYLTDAFIAPGLMVVAPFCVGLRRLCRDVWPNGILVAVTLGILVCATALSDGSQTGFLRERYFIYCFPLILAVAALGAREYFDSSPLWSGTLALFALPALCLFGVLLYDFHVPPLVEASWAHAVGAFSLLDSASFERRYLLRNGLVIIVVAGILLVSLRRWFAPLLAGFLLLFNAYALARVGHDISRVTAGVAERTAPLIGLFPKQATTLQKLVVPGYPPGFDNRFIPLTPRFMEANRAGGLTDDTIWFLETMGLFDVRMCGSPYGVLNPDLSGAYLLSTVDFPNVPLVNSRGWFRLYRIPALPARRLPDRPATYIRSSSFSYTKLTERTPAGTISGKGSNDSGLLVFGPYCKLSRGAYKATLMVHERPEALLRVECAAGNKVLEFEDAPANKVSPMWFVPDPSEPLEFRITGQARADFVFSGVELHREESDSRLAVVDYARDLRAAEFSTQIGQRLPDGSLTSGGRAGFLCYGPYRVLAPGKYKVKFNLNSPDKVVVRGDVAAGGAVLAAAEAAPDDLPPLEFSSDGKMPLEFRIVTPAGGEVRFNGVRVTAMD